MVGIIYVIIKLYTSTSLISDTTCYDVIMYVKTSTLEIKVSYIKLSYT